MVISRIHRYVVVAVAGIVLLVCQSTWGVIINSPTGVENTTSPAITSAYSDFQYWNNVGVCGVGTGIYLGNGWVLTADHVVASGTPSITLNGTVYNPLPGSTIRIETSSGAPVDMAMFQLARNPGLPSITIASKTPSSSDTLLMIGDGYKRAPNLTTSRRVTGYAWDTTGRIMRWGTNNLTGTASINDGFGTMQSLWTTFNDNGIANECQAASGDSGGAVFYKVGSQWELVGMIFAIGSAGSQVADYGSQTCSVNLPTYLAALSIPEPATLSLLTLGGLTMLMRRRKH